MEGLLKRKLVGEVEVGESAGDAFHEFIKDRPHDISIINPDFIQGCDLHEGSYGIPGSIITWRYTIDGKPLAMKELVEVVDEENKLVKFKCIEGYLFESYKSMDITVQVLPSKSNKSCIVRTTLEYEKKHLGVGEPSAEMDEFVQLIRQMNDHHDTQKN